jgi:hypothetical protein
MTSMADMIVFSAAVPNQDGDGHINCRSRSDWYQYIKQYNFMIADTLRQHFICNPNLGLWHKTNIVDYVKENTVFAERINPVELAERLIAAETFSASQCFHNVKQTQLREWAINLQPVKAAVNFRNILTRMLGKTSIEL